MDYIEMDWFDWLLIGIFSLSILVNISLIGKEREPLTPTPVIAQVILISLLIAGIILF